MTAQRMSSLEATFVKLESRDVPFVYAAILELDRPLALSALRDHVGAALADLPRYRQRMTRAGRGTLAWTEDEAFRIEHHVQAIVAPAPGGPQELEALAARLVGAGVPRDRSPWQLWTVEQLAEGRGALIAVVHHALVDGLAGIRLLEHLFGGAPGQSPPPPAPGQRLRALRRLARGSVIRASLRLLRQGLSPASDLGLNPRHTGPARAVASHSVERAAIERIERACGVTNNDVVLATVTGALRRFVARRGLDPDQLHDARAMVPVGRHGKGPRAASGNRVVLLLVPLPIDVADPLACLTRISAGTRRLKHGETAAAGDLLVAIADATSPAMLADVLALSLRVRAFNLVVTNVPGPAAPLTLLGANLVRLVPIVNLWPHHALDIAFATYAGRATFGVHADRAVVPEPGVFAADLADAFDALLAAVARRAPRRRTA